MMRGASNHASWFVVRPFGKRRSNAPTPRRNGMRWRDASRSIWRAYGNDMRSPGVEHLQDVAGDVRTKEIAVLACLTWETRLVSQTVGPRARRATGRDDGAPPTKQSLGTVVVELDLAYRHARYRGRGQHVDRSAASTAARDRAVGLRRPHGSRSSSSNRTTTPTVDRPAIRGDKRELQTGRSPCVTRGSFRSRRSGRACGIDRGRLRETAPSPWTTRSTGRRRGASVFEVARQARLSDAKRRRRHAQRSEESQASGKSGPSLGRSRFLTSFGMTNRFLACRSE